ncbi:MAG: PAS domain-containing sensor histidine kinase [Caloramator sp.]|nr:PAS domain-containing sensor histidine kinase [Caloramator sp.]
MQNSDINCNVLFSIIREMFFKSPVAAAICDTNGDVIVSNFSFQKLTDNKYSNITEILNINKDLLLQELKKNNNEYLIPKQDFSKINKNVPYVKARFYLMNLLNRDYISVVIIDITNAVYLEQKLQDEKVMLQKIFNDINDVIFMTDLKGIITYCSVSAEMSLGCNLKELIGKNLIDFIHPDDLSMPIDKCKIYVDKHPIVKNKTFRLKHKSGKYIWFEFSHISFLEENNEKIGTLIFLKENEEILKLQSEREKIYKELEYEKLKSEFICKVSHELRTPLNIIYGTVQLIELFRDKENNFVENFDKFFPILKKNMYRLLRLVNNIIDLTSIDAKNMGLHLQNINIISLVEDICNSVNHYLENKNVKIIYNPYIEEKIITCDVEKIERAILNLLSNAVKFSALCQ